jgi:hypothetical protein
VGLTNYEKKEEQTLTKDQILLNELCRIESIARSRPGPDDLLGALLAGFPRDEAHVKKLFLFAKERTSLDNVFTVCLEFLKTVVTVEEFDELSRPKPKAGEPGFESVLDELADQDPDVRGTIDEILGLEGKKQ